MMVGVVIAIILLVFMLWLFNYLNQKQKNNDGHELDELMEHRREQLALARLHIESNERRNLEQRAKVSLVNTTLPFIDRIIHEVNRMKAAGKNSAESLEYIRELTDKINEQNDVLTHWIQLRQGELSLHIESFALQPLFDMVSRGKMSFQLKGIELDVAQTDAVVKADKVLTLFMLNTLADNARKFTEKGGRVSISAENAENYVEVSVSDTGIGMTEEQLAHLFDHKTINDTTHHSSLSSHQSHGFGLMNCRGIIEKYRKVSSIFKVCTIAAESEQGRGTRLFFRLPKGRIMAMVLLFTAYCLQLTAAGQSLTSNPQTLTPKDKAYIYSDSAYFSNINGNYRRTLEFADSCRKYLNALYLQQHPRGTLLMVREGNTSQPIPEILWFRDSLDVNYSVILDIRNESAVAALALHEWSLCAYNNKV